MSNLHKTPPIALQPIQEHYLKRELVRLEIQDEFLELADFRGLRKFGSPFASNGPGHVTPTEDSNTPGHVTPAGHVSDSPHYTPTIGSPNLEPQSSGGSHTSVVMGGIKHIKKKGSHIKKHIHVPFKHGHGGHGEHGVHGEEYDSHDDFDLSLGAGHVTGHVTPNSNHVTSNNNHVTPNTDNTSAVVYQFPIVRHMFVHHIKTFPYDFFFQRAGTF